MKKIVVSMFLVILMITSCNKKQNGESNSTENVDVTQTDENSNGESGGVDDWKNNKGIGPVTSITIDPEINESMAKKGEEIFKAKCTACHKPDKKFIGPAPKDILERRTPEWVMNIILNPSEMIQKDPIAKQLLVEANGAPMANQNLTQEEARAVVEYFRTIK